ncbi:MATE family efflux transporter [Roseobacter sp. HKCCA0434]|uniref:MATE family efflux transporter n=1 Tax=Roseobacter sp. HKCCA0434 TaxID=3079297 RepID=UPI0029059846|nr:MATE family efflux transporter [Roseobacter sp. HKCCA0434]
MSGKERDLTTGSVAGHMRAVAVPAALQLLFVTLYNITDTFYAGRISTEAQAGLGIGSQLYFLIIATGIGFRIAMSAFVGNALGSGDGDGAARASAQGIGAAIGVTAIAMVAGYWGLPALINAVAADGGYAEAAATYCRIMLLAAPGFIITNAMTGLLSAQGDTVTQERGQLAATVVNVGLNPLLIWGIPGLWDGFGLNGIAVATALAQTGVMVYIGIKTARSDALDGLSWSNLRPRLDMQIRLFRQIVPACATIYVTVLGGVICQYFLREFGEDAVAAYGVGFRLQQLLLLPVIGLTTALLPMTAQNLGADEPDRIHKALRLTGIVALGVMVVGAIVIWTAGEPLVSLFNSDEAVIDYAVDYLRILSVALPFFALIFIAQNLLQGMEKPEWPLAIGLWRLGLGLFLFCLLFVEVLDLGVNGIWFALAAGAATGAAFATFIAVRKARQTCILKG